MENEKVNVTLPANYAGEPVTIILREGDAESIKSRTHLTKHVTVLSIGEYIRKRSFPTPVSNNPGVIVYSLNFAKPTLEFIEDPSNSEGVTLTSRLRVNPELEMFQINNDVFFSQRDLEKLIRKNAHAFANLDDAKKLIQDLQNFQVKYEQTVERSDNRQGDTKALVETSIKQNKGAVAKQWNLNMPLYVAGKKVPFTVEVEIEKLPNNLPGFGFYSMDLPILMRQIAEETIMKEVNSFSDNFVCLEVE